MPRYPETRALIEQALRHVLSEEEKLLKRPDVGELTDALVHLNRLAIATSNMLTEGFNRVKSTALLTRDAKKAEEIIDDLSEVLWKPVPISVSAIYQRIEQSFEREPGQRGLRADTRAHYHNLRLRLLEQMLGARMLALNADLGEEHERIWQQFLERHLGPTFRVLRGGHICDHDGNKSPQIDLIVVPADAHVFVPGDSDGGKAQVLVDHVISAIMVTSNLSVEKLKSDWRKLQLLPRYTHKDTDHPQLNGHPWPFCYMVAAQSDAAEDLKKAWSEVCEEGLTDTVPQFVVALDTGFLYGGFRKWPAPRCPTNYVNADDVVVETGIYGGLGLAWLLLQHQGRLAVMKRMTLGPITRFGRLLEDATLREAVPATYSSRFDFTFRTRPIAGRIGWGRVSLPVHNRLELQSLSLELPGTETVFERELLVPGTNREKLTFNSLTQYLRWFRFKAARSSGRLLAVEEWLDPRSKSNHRQRIAVFDTISGVELSGAEVESLVSITDLDNIRTELEATLESTDTMGTDESGTSKGSN